MDYLDLSLENSLGPIINRTARAMCSLVQSIFTNAGYDVKVEQCVVLMNLCREDGQFQQQLAENTYKDKASITRIVNGLEKRHLVKRVPDSEDKRQKRVYITSKGKLLDQKLKALALKAQEQGLNGVEPERWGIAKEVLLKIYSNVSKR